MSIKVMNYVWDHSNAQGTELLCLLAIADNANDDGEAFPGIARIAKKCRVGERAIQKVLRKLQDSGEIEVRVGHGLKTTTGHTNRYALLKYQEWVNSGSPHPTRGERGDTPGVNVGTPQGVNVGTPKPSVLTISKPSVKSKGARVDHSPVAQSAASTLPAAVPTPTLTQSEIDGFSEATNVKANALSPDSAAPPSRIVSDDPTLSGPKVIPKSRCVVTCRNFDPRKLVDGYIPAGKGETPTEVYLESFKMVPTKPQMEVLNREITNLPRWREVCSSVVLRNLSGKSYSFDNMLDIYRNGFREQKGFSDGNGGRNFGNSNAKNSQGAFAQQSGQKRYDAHDPSTWDREILATFDPDTLAAIESAEREGRVYSM